MRRKAAIATLLLGGVGLLWFFLFSPYWWYVGRHTPPWPSDELPIAVLDGVAFTPATQAGEEMFGAPFEYAFAGGLLVDEGLYLHVLVRTRCEPQYVAEDMAEQLSTVMGLAPEEWFSISGPDARSVRLGRRSRPRPVGPGKPDYISPRFGASYYAEPQDGQCRAVAVFWGKAIPPQRAGVFTLQTLGEASQIGLVPGQTYQIEVADRP